MDGTEDITDSGGNTSQNGGSTTKNVVKPKRRSLVERELETNLTARVTSPVSSAEVKGNTSRYGRTRRLKTDPEFCDSDKAIKTMFVPKNGNSTIKSPVQVTPTSSRLNKQDKAPSTETITSNVIDKQIEDIVTKTASSSRFSAEENKPSSPSKSHSKVYVRKDLIQSKEKEETAFIMKNMFSPTKSSYKRSTNTHLSNILERSSEKYSLKINENTKSGYIDTLSVVKTLDFDSGKRKIKTEESTKKATIVPKSELFEQEAKSVYQIGDLAWSRVGTYPFWPCIITRDPFSGLFVKKKLFGRVEREVYHVTFFGDNGRRGWIVDNMLRRYQGLEEFEATKNGFTPQSKKKDPRFYAAFFVSDKKRQSWNLSVQEAETLMREPKRLRLDLLNDILSMTTVLKTTPKRQKSEKIVRTDSDVSLSESLYDTLFSEDDSKADEQDKSKIRPRKMSLDVSDVVTACLDNMAAKTGIPKIQKQSHMDRWLQKAKSKTPEKPKFVPTKSKETKGPSSGRKGRKTPSKRQTQLIIEDNEGENENDSLGLLKITTAYQLNEHDYTKLDTENANPENNQNSGADNVIITNGINMEDSCGIGIIFKVETLGDTNKDVEKPTVSFDPDNNMSVATDELIVTEINETTNFLDESNLVTEVGDKTNVNKQNEMELDIQKDISSEGQDKMDVDATQIGVQSDAQSEIIDTEESQTLESTMPSNSESLQNGESPVVRVTRRSKRLSLDPNPDGSKTKALKVEEVVIADITQKREKYQSKKKLHSDTSTKLRKSNRNKKKDIIKGDGNLPNNISLEDDDRSDTFSEPTDIKESTITNNDSLEKSVKATIDVAKIIDDFSEASEDSLLNDVSVNSVKSVLVNGDISHEDNDKPATDDLLNVCSYQVQMGPIEANKVDVSEVAEDSHQLNKDISVLETNQDPPVNEPKVGANENYENEKSLNKECAQTPTDCSELIGKVAEKSPEPVLLNGELSHEIDTELFTDNITKSSENIVVNDVEKELSQEIPGIESSLCKGISVARDEKIEDGTKLAVEVPPSGSSEQIIEENEKTADKIVSINGTEVNGSLDTPDDKEHSEPMEVDTVDASKTTVDELHETAEGSDDDDTSEPESPVYEDISLDHLPINDNIGIELVSKEQNGDKTVTKKTRDEVNSVVQVPRTLSYNYNDELITLKDLEVKVIRMQLKPTINKLQELVEPSPNKSQELVEPKLNKWQELVEPTPNKSQELVEPTPNKSQELVEPTPNKSQELTVEAIEPVIENVKIENLKDIGIKSESSSIDDEDDMSLAAISRSYSEESKTSKESKPGQMSTKACAKPKRKPSKDKNTAQDKIDINQALDNPEFLKYLEIQQDALMDENPHVTEDEAVEYLFKTWLYSENLKSETVKSHDKEQSTLVKGTSDEPPPQPKKIRKKIKVEKEKELQSTEDIPLKDRSKRKVARAYYNENDTDLEDELQAFEIFKETGIKVENGTLETVNEQTEAEEFIDEVELFFEELAKPKPNVFKGIPRERVCEICEKPGNLIKCKGLCGNTFHIDCVKKEIETPQPTNGPTRGRKKKKRGRKPKGLDDSGSLSDDRNDREDNNISVDENLVIDADNFEAQLEVKMQEMLKTELPADYDYSSEDELQWNDTVAGKCEIVDVKLKLKRPENEYGDFKCNACLKNGTPVCFVCKSTTSPKNSVKLRQKCQTAHCHKYYHLECLDIWPQTQFSGGEPSKHKKKISENFEALTCPRHVCHTCVCDDPRGCNTRFTGDKLARCIRCPATYHSFNKCLPAGSTILSASQIICPRHYEHPPGKVPCHVNTGWCFICALGGTLICCEYCPTSFHAECLNIKPPEGNYMCEDCETGRLPLYGEMVWVKLGHYRWWPAIVLHPFEIPENIMAVKHAQGEFVVRFFGQYDHYWVNRGRVFHFQEGDSGRISSQKSKIDEAFTMAMEHAQRACEVLKNAAPNEEEDTDIASSLLPPHYVKLKVNKPCGALVTHRPDDDEHSLTLCECDPRDTEPCGHNAHCLNRMLLTECGPTCRAGDRCHNRAFEMRLYPKLTPYRTSWGGWGLKTLEPIRQGQFVIEYVGELLDEAEFRRRMQRKHETRDENYYFLTLDRERMIDAGPKGNLARFMNHCCEPNCETQKWTVLGDVRVGLFALRDIPANSEVTFNYNLECAGIEKKPCLCGAKRCSGYIGAKPKQEETQPKKGKLPIKRVYKKRKHTNIELSPSTSKKVVKPRTTQRSRPKEEKELSEIEKDLLIIKNATNGQSSDSEGSSRLSSVENGGFHVKEEANPLKRKRVSFSTDEVVVCNGEVNGASSPVVKKMKMESGTLCEVGD